MPQLEYRILGPLDVRDGEQKLPLGGGKQRALLAILLLNANRTVSNDRLIDGLWGERPPKTAATILHGYVSHLRKLIERERGTSGSYRVLVTEPVGYRLDVSPEQLDLHSFERLADEGRSALARDQPDVAAAKLREALSLWRGAALAEFAYESFAAAETGRLEELRLAVLEERIDADLALGKHSSLVGELEALIAENPLRERLRAQLMLALYRSGRQSEALSAYQEARRVLVEQFGIEPSRALQQLEKEILLQEASLDLEERGRRAPEGGTLPPERSILIVPAGEDDLRSLVALAEPLARSQQPHELIVARLLAPARAGDELARASGELQELRAELTGRGIAVRSAAFTSAEWGEDVVRLASEQAVDLVLLGVPHAWLAGGDLEPELRVVLTKAPSHVALCAEPARLGGIVASDQLVVVPFVGAEHDWAALELGAWIASASDARLGLLGVTGDVEAGRRDASRLLASASLAVQQLAGLPAEPLLVPPGAVGLQQAAEQAALVVIGLSDQWREEGLGNVRASLVRSAVAPTLVVRRGVRPGGLAPRESVTRFTWSLSEVRSPARPPMRDPAPESPG